MKEIKFRGWHKAQKTMYSPEEMGRDQLTLMPDGRGFANIHSASTRLSAIDGGRKMIPLQYTGLKDKNGKEIYEGDVLSPNRRVVMFIGDGTHNMGVGYYTLCHTAGYPFVPCTFSRTQAKVSEIIGNIYENPELGDK